MADNKTIQLKIITPSKTIFEDETYQVTLPVIEGIVTVLPNHRSYIGALQAGEVVLKDKNSKEQASLAIAGGFVEFNQNKMTVLADAAEYAEEIDLKQAEEAKQRAEKIMQEKVSLDEVEYAKIAAELETQIAKIKVAKRHRSKSKM